MGLSAAKLCLQSWNLEVEEAMAAASLPWEVACGLVRLYVNYEFWSLVIN